MPRDTRSPAVKDLQRRLGRAGRTANARLTRLENMDDKPPYEGIRGFAYRAFVHDLRALGYGNRVPVGLSKSLQPDYRRLQHVYSITLNFLQSPTSTKSGYDKLLRQRVNSLNQEYGINLTVMEFDYFVHSNLWEKFLMKYGSKETIAVIGLVKKNANKILDDAAYARRRHQRIEFTTLSHVSVDDMGRVTYNTTTGVDMNERFDAQDKKEIIQLARIMAHR